MTTLTRPALRMEVLKPHIGALILNTKEELLDGGLAADIMQQLETSGVLVFPQLHLTDAEQLVFTSSLGKLAREITGEVVQNITLDVTKNASAEYLKGALFWHFDGFMSPMPIRASMLSCKAVSPPGTGDTRFANTYSAYEALSDKDKRLVEGLHAVHALAGSQLYITPEPSYEEWKAWRAIGRKELPLVWTHKSGRKSLVIGNSAHAILDFDPLDGKELLVRLRDFATQDDFTYTHTWTVGDTVLWDNTGTLHRVSPYPLNSGRMMHRTKLEGDEPIQ